MKTNTNEAVKYSLKNGDTHVIGGTEYKGRNPVYSADGARIAKGIPFVRVEREKQRHNA